MNAYNRKAPLPPNAIQSVVRLYTEFKNQSSVLNRKRNERSMVGEAIKRSVQEKDEKAKQEAMQTAKRLKEEITDIEVSTSQMQSELLQLALAIPNDTHPSSPLGPESSAVTLATRGPSPIPADPARDHVSIAKKFNLIDFDSAATVTGSSWYYLLNEAALLESALTNYALSVAIKHGFTPVTTPDVVRSDIARRCGFQPRDNAVPPVSQSYHLQSLSSSSPELILSGTSEIPLAGMFANRLYLPQSLPFKVVGVGHSFRAEAGARGADTRGIYRVHQFTKVELFTVTDGESSEKMMEDMKEVQQAILDGLQIPYRVLDMPTEELGASAYRKYDMEAWMPGRGGWGEVSSLSNCTDYQARRLHIRYQPPPPEDPVSTTPPTLFTHTLNGTAAAIPRLIVALLENGVRFDEKGEPVALVLPAVLRPFWLTDSSRNIVEWNS
ncbi:Serine--tRNA ligase, mitochondrial [Marasmius crinis-equi]|uniref:serine--tRNA ligase n=1 Tax=Marasmius crinis-equi TaxID=585013 RepID=A0ABR3FSP5_9AGAR